MHWADGPALMLERRSTSRPLLFSAAILVAVLGGSLALVLFSSQGVVTIAMELFFLSAIGFSLIASHYYRSVLFWRAVDFPWILTSFAAIVVSLVNISANDDKQLVATARGEIARAFSDLTYVTRSIITNDCEAQPAEQDRRPPGPEPYGGACDRMRHFLPQMINASDKLSDTKSLSDMKEWARNLSTPQGEGLSGGWKDQAAAVRNLVSVVDKYGPWLQKGDLSARDTIEGFILSTRLRLWYFAMAFFVGLRLSKTTAEVLQARAARPP